MSLRSALSNLWQARFSLYFIVSLWFSFQLATKAVQTVFHCVSSVRFSACGKRCPACISLCLFGPLFSLWQTLSSLYFIVSLRSAFQPVASAVQSVFHCLFGLLFCCRKILTPSVWDGDKPFNISQFNLELFLP